MPNDRAPRGAKPKSGRPAPSPAKGGRSAAGPRGGRPAAAGKPERAGAAPRPGKSSRFGAAPAEAPKRGRAEGPARDRSEGPARGRAEGTGRGRRDEGATRAPREHFKRDEALAPRERVEEREENLGGDIVFGRHAALAVLEGEQEVNKVWVLNGLKNQELIAKVRQLAKEKGAIVQMVERPKLDSLTLDQNHQGIVVSVAPASYVELEDVIEKARQTKYPALLMLDGIEDPHNLGALIRSAEGAGFAGVIIPNRRAVGLTPVAVKSSAGAALRVPIARVGNLAQAAEALGKAGFWLLGADASGEKVPYQVDMIQPLVVVVGGEGKGLSPLLAKKCDFVVKLPLGGDLESLNASVAGGVLMYEAVRQRWVREQA